MTCCPEDGRASASGEFLHIDPSGFVPPRLLIASTTAHLLAKQADATSRETLVGLTG